MGSVVVKNRTVSQGPSSIHVEYAGNKASGTMSMNGQDHAITADITGPLFADGAGAAQAIGCLPLAEGYSQTFRNFDVQSQKVKVMQLQVAGSESITVPAGKFDTYRIELTSAEGGPEKATFWVAKDSRKVVKTSTVMVQMNGAVLTTELLP
jgi:hypothetical protein